MAGILLANFQFVTSTRRNVSQMIARACSDSEKATPPNCQNKINS